MGEPALATHHRRGQVARAHGEAVRGQLRLRRVEHRRDGGRIERVLQRRAAVGFHEDQEDIGAAKRGQDRFRRQGRKAVLGRIDAEAGEVRSRTLAVAQMLPGQPAAGGSTGRVEAASRVHGDECRRRHGERRERRAVTGWRERGEPAGRPPDRKREERHGGGECRDGSRRRRPAKRAAGQPPRRRRQVAVEHRVERALEGDGGAEIGQFQDGEGDESEGDRGAQRPGGEGEQEKHEERQFELEAEERRGRERAGVAGLDEEEMQHEDRGYGRDGAAHAASLSHADAGGRRCRPDGHAAPSAPAPGRCRWRRASLAAQRSGLRPSRS